MVYQNEFWRWYHRQYKEPGDPDIGKKQAEDLHKWWKENGEPDAEGHRTKDDDEEEGESCDAKNDEHSSSNRTIGAKDVLELILLGVLSSAITIFAPELRLQPAGVITPTHLTPSDLFRNGDNCPYCT
jgi:hypothetical protein